MAYFWAVFQALVPLFVLILLGYSLRKRNVLRREHVPILHFALVNAFLPATIIRGLAQAPTLSPRILLLPLPLLMGEVVVLTVVWFLGSRAGMARRILGAMLLTSAFGNTSFLGYPIALVLMPAQFPAAVLVDEFGMTIPLYTFAPWLGARLGGGGGNARAAILRYFRGPLFLAVLAGLAVRFTPMPAALYHLPAAHLAAVTAWRCIDYLAQGTTPVVLVALGVSLIPTAVRQHAGPILLACAAKLMLSPLIVWAVCRSIGLSGADLHVCVLQAAMPSAVMAAVLSGQHGLDEKFGVGAVCAATVLSLFTIPIILTLLH